MNMVENLSAQLGALQPISKSSNFPAVVDVSSASTIYEFSLLQPQLKVVTLEDGSLKINCSTCEKFIIS